MNRSPAYSQGIGGSGYDCRTSNWSYDEVEKLVEIWSDPKIQYEMETTYRNFPVYEKIARRLLKYGIDRSGFQCRVKVKNLKSNFTKAKDGLPHELENLKLRLPYFNIIENLMTHKNGDITLCASDVKREFSDDDEECDEEFTVYKDTADHMDMNENHSQPESSEELPSASGSQNLDHIAPADSSASVSRVNYDSISDSQKVVCKKRKKQCFENEEKESGDSIKNESLKIIFEKLDTMQTTLLEGFKSIQRQMSEERKFYMECEERRLKFFAELEEKRRRDEREHELKLFQMFSSVLQGKLTNSTVTNNDQNNMFSAIASTMSNPADN